MGLADDLISRHRNCNPSCRVSRCSKEGCNLPLGDPHRFVCIDPDRCAAFPPDRKKPDYVILEFSTPCWVIVEMKGKTVHAGKVEEQLAAAAEIIASDRRFDLEVTRIVPLVLCQKIHSQESRSLQGKRVLFHGKKYPIRAFRCGTPLPEILEKSIV